MEVESKRWESMKQKIIKSLLAIACLLGSTSVSAYDFEVDGIYYNVVSLSGLTCKVTSGNSKYTGDVVIPATVNYSNRTLTVVGIADEVFRNCSNLTGITIPNTISSIGNYMFNGCTKLATVTIEDGKTTLSLGYNSYTSPGNGKGLFYDCPITTLYFGRNLSYDTAYYYGYSPFYSVKTLQEVTISNSVTEIGYNAFYGCSGLMSVHISDLAVWCRIKFNTDYTNPLRYAHHLYLNNEEITDLLIPNSVTSIGSYAFIGCSGLESVAIGNSVTSIGTCAFEDCRSLTNITLGNSVTEIGNWAFAGCSGLTSLYSLNTTPPSIGSDNFTNNQYMTLNVYVPQEALTAYQSANRWKDFWNLQGFDPTGIDVTLMNSGEKTIKAAYDLGGKQLSQPQQGLNIVKMSDGTTKKIAVK